jgi:hypothetical protein
LRVSLEDETEELKLYNHSEVGRLLQKYGNSLVDVVKSECTRLFGADDKASHLIEKTSAASKELWQKFDAIYAYPSPTSSDRSQNVTDGSHGQGSMEGSLFTFNTSEAS